MLTDCRHGNGLPGSVTFVSTMGIDAFQRELLDSDYTYMKHGISVDPWAAASKG